MMLTLRGCWNGSAEVHGRVMGDGLEHTCRVRVQTPGLRNLTHALCGILWKPTLRNVLAIVDRLCSIYVLFVFRT